MSLKQTTVLLSAGAMGAVMVASQHRASADQVNTQTYTVQSGDTLSQIAQRFQTTTAAIASSNQVLNHDQIYVGQRLVIQSANNISSGDWLSYFRQALNQVDQTVTQATTPVQDSAEDAALKTLIFRESSGNVNATNGIYYGIGQLSPQNRARYGGNTADYNDQLQAMQAYIHDRYGSAVQALAHHDAMGWY
ncbi:LysM domain-containing protein [Lactobacillaceae bacterium L1_55_11]|nr:LysM domain-containing protein [Lactobacillaceae bacterium L1_55_11]